MPLATLSRLLHLLLLKRRLDLTVLMPMVAVMLTLSRLLHLHLHLLKRRLDLTVLMPMVAVMLTLSRLLHLHLLLLRLMMVMVMVMVPRRLLLPS
jgi:hypothetical protein